MKQSTTLQERAHRIGTIVGVNAYRVNRAALRQGLITQGYEIQETPHFLIAESKWDMCRDRFIASVVPVDGEPTNVHGGRDESVPTIVAHWFAPSEIDANLGHFAMSELKPFGLLTNPERFGDVFGAIVMSLSPRDPKRAWRLYGMNTLTRYHTLIDHPPVMPHTEFPIEVFATLYKRICELQMEIEGTSLLDAGCSFGSLPLVVAERIPSLKRVVGVDIETSSFGTIQFLAVKRHLTTVQFQQADLLTDEVEQLGRFDTITILHVLEHFTEEEMYRVLSHLLQVVQMRLIIAVPYEEGKPEEAYGHKQLFTAEKLETVGRWCVEKMGRGTFEVEACVGGLLVFSVEV